MDGDTIPQEAGINERAVSFTKGCYVGPGDGGAAALQGQAEPPPARPAAVGAGRARRRDPARRARWWAGSARRASRRGSARSRWPSSAARRRPATRSWWRAAPPPWPSCPSAVTERRDRRRAPRSRHGLTGASPLLGGPLTAAAGAEEPRAPCPALRRPRRRRSTCRARRRRRLPEPRELRDADPARRGRPRAGRLGPLASASSTCVEPRARLLLPVLVPRGGGGRGERARRGRRAARVEPLRRAASGRADDHAGDPPRAPAAAARSTCSASTGSRAIPASGCSPTRSASWPRTPPTPSACCATRAGSRSCSPRARRASRKLYWQRYRLRRFGRGGFVRTAIRAGVPIVPIAVVGAEEAMPIFAHVPLLQRLTGLIYFPVNHAFPHFGLAAAGMYLPAKFKIRFLEPVDLSALRRGGRRRRGARPAHRRGHPRPHPGRARLAARCAHVRLVRLGSVRRMIARGKTPRGRAAALAVIVGRGARRAAGRTTSRTSRARRCRSSSPA